MSSFFLLLFHVQDHYYFHDLNVYSLDIPNIYAYVCGYMLNDIKYHRGFETIASSEVDLSVRVQTALA